MTKKISRREFHKNTMATTGLAFGLAALQTETSHAKILGANDTIRCGFVGVANRGRQLLDAFLKCDNMSIAALCDIDSATLEQSAGQYAPEAFACHDFRELLDRDDLDALVIATPDQWHAYQTIETCKAGKDVYIEKPLSSTIREGQMMIDAVKKYERVVQVGVHRRSSPLYKMLDEMNLDNKIGRVATARCSYMSNMYPNGMGVAKPAQPPQNLDWDLWLGPKPFQEYQENIAPYKFRWWIQYCSQIANQGVHLIDLIRWILHEDAPISVCTMGGKFVVNDDRTIPDTQETIFQFASGRIFTFTLLESSSNPVMATDANGKPLGWIEFRGTNGTLYAYDNQYQIKPECGGQFQDHLPRMEEEFYSVEGKKEGNLNLTQLHAQNFLDCMRTRETPYCPVEEAHRSTSMSLMANISLLTGRRLYWNAEKSEFCRPQSTLDWKNPDPAQMVSDDQANAYLSYEYREPWKLEL